MRGTTLANLLLMLKKELGLSTTTGVGSGQDTELKGLLADMQQWLWSQHQWPFLYRREDIAMVGGTRYYNYPTVVSLDYPTKVECKWGNFWFPVDYGIKGEQYEAVDPDQGRTLDPVARWQNYTATQYEVWPVPSTGTTLRWWGTSALTALTADADTALLDDQLIVLFTAAEKLVRSKQADAGSKLARAKILFNRLRSADRPNTVFPLCGDPEWRRRPYRVVGIVGNTNH
jgi:hypothetical protein